MKDLDSPAPTPTGDAPATPEELSLVEEEEQSMVEAAAWTAAHRPWTGAWNNWIAPFHACPRCGASLNWKQGEDVFDRPMIGATCCGLPFAASLTWQPPVPAPAVAVPRGNTGGQCFTNLENFRVAPSRQEESPAPTETLAHCNNCGGYMGSDYTVAPSDLVDGVCVNCAGVVLYRRNRTLEDRIVQGRAQNGRLMTRQSELTAALSTERADAEFWRADAESIRQEGARLLEFERAALRSAERRAGALREAAGAVLQQWDDGRLLNLVPGSFAETIVEDRFRVLRAAVERPEADAVDPVSAANGVSVHPSSVSSDTANSWKREAHADALAEAQVCDREEATRRAVRRYPSAHAGSRCAPVQVRGERRCACEFSP